MHILHDRAVKKSVSKEDMQVRFPEESYSRLTEKCRQTVVNPPQQKSGAGLK